jgi:predicted small lipoprotein YifL
MPAARLACVALSLLALTACGSNAPEPPKDKAKEQALGRDTDATVLDDMIQTQDRARAVENLTLGRKDDLDQAMKQAEGDAPADR